MGLDSRDWKLRFALVEAEVRCHLEHNSTTINQPPLRKLPFMTGTIINIIAVLIGGAIGALAGKASGPGQGGRLERHPGIRHV